MVNRAIDKIRDEMAAVKGSAVHAIGEMMTQLMAGTRGDTRLAEAVLATDKTLKGAYKALETRARDQEFKINASCACVPPDKALEIILEYYGAGANAGARASTTFAFADASADDWDIDALIENAPAREGD